MSLPDSFLSLATAFPASPLSRVELAHGNGSPSVVDATYFWVLVSQGVKGLSDQALRTRYADHAILAHDEAWTCRLDITCQRNPRRSAIVNFPVTRDGNSGHQSGRDARNELGS